MTQTERQLPLASPKAHGPSRRGRRRGWPVANPPPPPPPSLGLLWGACQTPPAPQMEEEVRAAVREADAAEMLNVLLK